MRYIIGIDLGTTNSCAAYVDIQEAKAGVQSFKIPQLIAEGYIESLPALPSCCYLAAKHEWSEGSIDLPWMPQAEYFLGSFAQTQGAKVPTRLVQSAKSWLCHNAANRRDKILPLESADESMRISPVEATTRFLRHIREAWNEVMAKGESEAEFDHQEIILTVPASFDEVARSLTVEAAHLAGYRQMILLEEPQAAFYSWIAQHENQWEKILPLGSTILVCDVGGGTTDFSLIDVVAKEEKRSFQRMAVGDHLLLGGDNMDAAIAHLIESKFIEKGHELSSLQRLQLRHEARRAKELLLHSSKKEQSADRYRVLLQGTGSSVVQGTISVEVAKNEVHDLLYQGFFGQYSWSEALKLRKTAGFRTMGLPYENEPSITKHLAYFLAESGGSSEQSEQPKKPDFVLFNGGAMKPPLFQEAVVESLKRWFPEKVPKVLPSHHLDLAVGRGAAYYGKVRHGLGVKIGGGSARGYYLILDAKDSQGKILEKALSLIPRGSEEGYIYEPDTTFWLTPNTPVSFRLATSHVRLHDDAGSLINIESEEMHILPPIQTILQFGKKQNTESTQDKIPVHLQICLTPIGTVEIGLKSLKTEHRWRLEFQVRSVSGQENSLGMVNKPVEDRTFQAGYLNEAETLMQQVFGPVRGTLKAARLMEKLEELFGMPRRDWPPSVMRGLADILLKSSPQRKLSADYAERWWNIAGFLIRPGFGYTLDDFRIKELWKVILNDFKVAMPLETQIQMWICFRRVAGGFNKGQQMQIANDLIVTLLNKRNGKIELKSKAELYPYSEKIRALAAMELIDQSLKMRLGKALVERITSGQSNSADFWALGRIGARHLLYGSLVNAVSRSQCEEWIDQLLAISQKEQADMAFLLGQLARKTEHRELNLSKTCVDKILNHFHGSENEQRLEELLLQENQLTQSEQEQAFGDRLPAGLMLHE